MHTGVSLRDLKDALEIHLKITVAVLYLTTREASPLEPTTSEPTHLATFSHVSVSEVVFCLWGRIEAISSDNFCRTFPLNHLSVTERTWGVGMAEGGYPSVYVVDSYATRPPVPPRLSKGRQRAGVAQTLLFLLVSVALCGMAIEACLIYRLFHLESGTSASSSKLISDEDVASPIESPSPDMLPSKPVAHLTDGKDVVHEDKIMAWSMDANPLLYQMDYKNGSLLIQQEGFYFVYSKVSFLDSDVFHHSIDLKTERYSGKSIPLLMSRKISEFKKNRSNSYLGGVFHLHKGDALVVKVSDTLKVLRYKSFENIFGAYMI